MSQTLPLCTLIGHDSARREGVRMASLISKSDISILNNHALRSVVNALLTVEANKWRVPLTDLDLSLRDTAPDQGIDAFVIWPDGTGHDLLAAGPIALQYKSGMLSRGEIQKEFMKPGVQATLDKPNGRYLLVVSHAYVKAARDRHRKQLRALCVRRKIDPARCTVVYGDQIARWISRFPSVVIRPELGKGFPAFETVQGWQRHGNLMNPYRSNSERDEVIKQVRAFASGGGDSGILRVEGQAGVGKTRAVLEALRIRPLGDSTLYCLDSDDPNALQMLALIQSDPEASAVIVFDECERERQETLRAYVDASAGRVRLICIGPVGEDSPVPSHVWHFLSIETPTRRGAESRCR
jgi:hypothetical protein